MTGYSYAVPGPHVNNPKNRRLQRSVLVRRTALNENQHVNTADGGLFRSKFSAQIGMESRIFVQE